MIVRCAPDHTGRRVLPQKNLRDPPRIFRLDRQGDEARAIGAKERREYNSIMASLDQRLTYADLLEMPDDGTRYELIDGGAYVIPSPNAKHQTVLLELAIRLREAIRDRSTLFIAPLDVVLADDTVLQPDLLLVTPGGRAQIKRGVEGPPDLAVEILSRTSVRRDRGVKRAAYARFGVGEYWLVDLNQQAIEVYHLDPGTKPDYHVVRIYRPGEILTTPLLPALALDPRQVFASLV
jgi:Uma2 family endonuclease